LRELFHATKSLQITEASRRCGILGKKIDECPLEAQSFGDSLPLHLSRHQRSGSHADGASLPGEANVLNRAVPQSYGAAPAGDIRQIQEALKKDIADLRAVVDALDHAFQKEWIRVDWRKGARDS
jgi:hypothetical protein